MDLIGLLTKSVKAKKMFLAKMTFSPKPGSPIGELRRVRGSKHRIRRLQVAEEGHH